MNNFLFFHNNKRGGDNITFKYRYRKQILLGIIIFILLLGGGVFTYFKLKDRKVPSKEISFLKKEEEEEEEISDKSEKLFRLEFILSILMLV